MRKLEKKCRRWIALLLVTAFVMSGQPYQSCGNIEANAVKAQTKTASQEKIVERTETSTIYDLGNGKKKAEIYSRKVRFTDDDGELRDYDTSLVRMEEKKNKEEEDLQAYAYRTRQSDKMAYFPEKLTDDTPVLTENEGYQAGISPALKKETKKKTGSQRNRLNKEKVVTLDSAKKEAATSVEYENIAEGTVFQYEATNNGLKENIVLERPAAGNKHSFCIRLKNCCIVPQEAFMKNNVREYKELRTKSGESLYLYDAASDRLAGCIPAAFMYDAEGDYSGDCSYAVKLEQRRKTDGETIYEYKLTVIADEEYLKDPERAYPVTIDPTVTWNENVPYRLSSAYVCATAPNATYTDNNTNILCVGKREQASDVCRAYIRFADAHSLLRNKDVDSAKLILNTVNATKGMNIYVRPVTSNWEASMVTYNNQPQKGSQLLGGFVTSASSQKITTWLSANELQKCLQRGTLQHGIELTDSMNDQNATSSKTAWVYSTSSVNTDKIPKLEVVYNEREELSIPHLYYNIYGNSTGWSSDYSDGATAAIGSSSVSARAFSMDLDAYGLDLGTVRYQAYFSETGWTDWVLEGGTAGNINQNYKLKGVRIEACNSGIVSQSSKYDIYYRCRTQSGKWLGWAKNGEDAGECTATGSITAIQAVIVPKLTFSMNYLSGGSQKSTGNYSFPKFPLPVGNGGSVYGIKAQFADSKLNGKHIINTIVYQKSGTEISQNTNTGVMAGANPNNCLTGLRMQFTDAEMSSRYDIEHMICTAGSEEETWKKNTVLSGTTSGNKGLEMMSVRIVPKNYDSGARACVSNQFVTTEDEFSFGNSHYDFGYPDGYRIPEQKYIDLLGETEGHDKYVSDGKWEGSCFGMALASQLFFREIWNLTDFQGNIDNTASSAHRLSIQLGRKSRALTDLIEYAQISWYLGGQGTVYEQTKDINTLITKLQENTDFRYIMHVCREGGGHAVIPLSISSEDGNRYKVGLYDVNHPEVEKFAYIDKSKKTFQYDTMSHHYNGASLIDISELLTTNSSKYNEIAKKVSDPAYNMRSSSKEQYSIMLSNCVPAAILDEDGNDITENERVEAISSLNGDGPLTYHLPKGRYQIKLQGSEESGRISILNRDTSVSYTISDEGVIDVVFNNDNTIDSSLQFTDGKAHEVEMETYDRHKNQKLRTLRVREAKVFGAERKSSIRKIK